MPVVFGAPWILAALLALPLLWRLLKLVPPRPRTQIFPAVRLLVGLTSKSKEAERTPRWLLILRMVLAALLIVAAAHPVIVPNDKTGGDILLLAVDNGWASARQWPETRQAVDALLDEAERAGRPVALLPTAQSPGEDGAVEIVPAPAGEIKAKISAMVSLPWGTDRARAGKALDRYSPTGTVRVVWLADGLDDPAAVSFARSLASKGTLDVVLPRDAALPHIASLASVSGNGDPAVKVRKIPSGAAGRVTVRALDREGRILAVQSADMAAESGSVTLSFPMPTELRNRIARFDLDGEESAATTILLDDGFRHRVAGLIDKGGASSPLLDDLYYADRALVARAEVRRGSVAELLSRDVSMIVLPDSGRLGDEDRDRLARWVEGGGVLLRFAGPRLAGNPDNLLPVRLLNGGRTLGGAMSWTRPMALSAAGDGALAGLDMPTDVVVSAQVLAEPSVDLPAKSWARLADGTPLVTGAAMGKGWLVLVHTTAGPGWSNLGLSGLFPRMMERLLDLGRGAAAATSGKALAPLESMDGFGRLSASGEFARPIEAAGDSPRPGPRHPPGYYGTEQRKVALNLGASLPDPEALRLPPGTKTAHLGDRVAERDLQPPLLIAALTLLLCDLAASLWLKGAFARVAAVLLCSALFWHVFPVAGTALAADRAEQAALSTRLAFVVTGDPTIDEISRAGLKGLSLTIAGRTTAAFAEPAGIDPETDDLAVYPLLYWPVTDRQPDLGAKARERLNDFMRNGGMILLDTRDRAPAGSEALARLTQGLDIPPLAPVTDAHVLTHSFYILREFPGRYASGAVYAAKGGDPANDNVSPVVIGGADWAGAWALDKNGAPAFPVSPGGEAQREIAYRVGVNIVMYALTGSYKADQVHTPAILERMRK